MQSLFFVVQMACQQSAPIEPRPESPPSQKEEIPKKIETKITGVPIWTASVEEKSTDTEYDTPIFIAGSGTGRLLYAYPNGWKIDDGMMQSVESRPLLIAWSHARDEVGILLRVGSSYKLQTYDSKTNKNKQKFLFSMPEPDTSGDYADPAPSHLVHIPEQGWMVSSSYGLFAVKASGLERQAHKRMFPDMHGMSSMDRKSEMIAASKCPYPQSVSWSSRWNTMIVHCNTQGGNLLQWVDLSTKSVVRSLELGVGVSSVSFLDEDTVVALERDMLVRWSATGHTRELFDGKSMGCSAYLLASQVMEVFATSSKNTSKMWTMGPSIGGRFQNKPWKLASVDMQTCSMQVKDIRGQLALNDAPIWLEKQRSFLAEINDKKRYGPALIDVDSPASWTYLFEENVDPGLYKISGDVLGIGTYEWTRIFSLKEKELEKTSELFPADDLLICPNTISRLRYQFHQWVVHDMEGVVVGVVDGAKKDISCPTPP